MGNRIMVFYFKRDCFRLMLMAQVFSYRMSFSMSTGYNLSHLLFYSWFPKNKTLSTFPSLSLDFTIVILETVQGNAFEGASGYILHNRLYQENILLLYLIILCFLELIYKICVSWKMSMRLMSGYSNHKSFLFQSLGVLHFQHFILAFSGNLMDIYLSSLLQIILWITEILGPIE